MAQDKPTLCWSCENACCGCSWSRSFKPVDGWTAVPTKVFAKTDFIASYRVMKCPQYKSDLHSFKTKTNGLRDYSIVKEKKQLKQQPIRGSARWRLSKLPDLQDRINRLSGDCKEIADLVFNYNYTTEDIVDAMYMEIATVKRYMYRAFQLMEAMA